MATSYGDEGDKPFTKEEFEAMIAAGEAYKRQRAEIAPKALAEISEGEHRWCNGVLAGLTTTKSAMWVGAFLEGVFCDIEREKLEPRVPAMHEARSFLALCKEAGCSDVALNEVRRFSTQETYAIPSSLRCCLLRLKKGPLLAFGQLELYARVKSLRFARPEELLNLAIAAPTLRFERCYALGTYEDGGNFDGHAWMLGDYGTAEKTMRCVHRQRFPLRLTAGESVLAVKID